MKIRKFDLNLLPVFRALFVHRSVSGAAAELGLTQPAVSHALARLREHYDDPLFIRIRNRMEPTPRACEFATSIVGGLEQVEATLGKRSLDQRQLERTFHIGLVSYSGFFTLPALTERLGFEAPKAQVVPEHMSSLMARQKLLAGDIDMAMGVLPHLRSPFRQKPLLNSSFIAVVRRDHPFRGRRISFKELGNYQHLRVPIFDHLEQSLIEQSVRRRFTMTCPNLLAVPFTVARSDLIAIIPSRLAMVFMDICQLRAVTLPAVLPAYEMSLAYHQRFEHDPAHQWMVRSIVALSGEISEQLPQTRARGQFRFAPRLEQKSSRLRRRD